MRRVIHFVPRYYIHFRDQRIERDEHPNFVSALHTWRKFGAVPTKMYASDDESEREHGDGLTAAELAKLEPLEGLEE